MPRRKSFAIKVTTREKDGNLYLRHRDPVTKKEYMRLAVSKTPSEIERECWRWERELEETAAGLAAEKQRKEQLEKAEKQGQVCSWKRFRERLREEHLLSLSFNAAKAFTDALVVFERLTPDFPTYVSEINESHVSQFASAYRNTGVAETSIASRLTHIRAALEWGKTHSLIQAVPVFPTVKRARKGQRVKPARGRAIREDEFDSILKAVAPDESKRDGISKEARQLTVDAWRWFLKGLWWSGLRLGEALTLSWDCSSPDIRVDMERFTHPMLIIPGDREKGGKDRIYPVAPEFAELLWEKWRELKKPSGLVFPLVIRRSPQNRDSQQIGIVTASAKIINICREAKVFTHYRGRGKSRKEQAGGAHDFRRSFGDRWARRVRPFVLQQMMRHESIETTMQYYVGLESEDLAIDIYAAYEAFVRMNSRNHLADHSPNNSPATNKNLPGDDEPGLGIS